jgi:hypothetical protein
MVSGRGFDSPRLHQTCYFETLSPMNDPLATCRGSASFRGLLVRVCAAWGVAAGDASRDEVAVLGAVWGGFALWLSVNLGLATSVPSSDEMGDRTGL